MIDKKYIFKNYTYLLNNLKKKYYNLNIKNLNEIYIYIKLLQIMIQKRYILSSTIIEFYNIKNKKNLNDGKLICKIIFKTLNLLCNNLETKINKIPNLVYTSNNNILFHKILYNWGKYKRESRIKNHFNFSTKYIDFNISAKLSGSRFVVLKKNFARLHRALEYFMMNFQIDIYDYQEHHVPELVRYKTMYKSGQFPKFINDQFGIKNSDLWLIPTGEVPLINIMNQNIFSWNDLPVKMICATNCFRKEIGNYGKDTKGMFRQHQFKKVEVIRVEAPFNSCRGLEKLKYHVEMILQALHLSYRIIKLHTDDTGFSSYLTYDIEIWMPSENDYREVSSCSNCTDFQSRRMSTKWNNPWTNLREFVHTLNGSSLAVVRTFIAVIENYQYNNSIIIPHVLRPYMNNENYIKI